MSIRQRACGAPRGDGCGKPIGANPYVVRHDHQLNQSVVYHLECERKLPPIELWTTVDDQVVAAKIAREVVDKAWEEFVQQAWTKHANSIKAKHKKLLAKYPKVKDEDIKEQAKHGLRR